MDTLKFSELERKAMGMFRDRKTISKNLQIGGMNVKLVGKTPITVLSERYDCSGFRMVTTEAGGGGDCFFHSIVHILKKIGVVTPGANYTFQTIRDLAASAISADNVDQVLIDMVGIYVENTDDEMVASPRMSQTRSGCFNPINLWNATRRDKNARVNELQKVISTPGSYFWGDITTAALLEDVFDVNIFSLSVRKGRITATRNYIGVVSDLAKVSSLASQKRPTPSSQNGHHSQSSHATSSHDSHSQSLCATSSYDSHAQSSCTASPCEIIQPQTSRISPPYEDIQSRSS